LAKSTTTDWSLSANVYSLLFLLLLKDRFLHDGAQKLEGCSSVVASDLIGVHWYAKGAGLLFGVFLLLPFEPKRWTECKQHRVGRGILSIFTAVAISQKIRSSIPIREAADANPFPKLDSRTLTVTPSGLKDIMASRLRNNSFKICI
jgi:hypothetical protein